MPEKYSRSEFLKMMGYGAAGFLFAGIANQLATGKENVIQATAATSTSRNVNVRNFGALGQVLTTTGTIRAGSSQLTVANAHGWVRGAGVGVPGAAADGTALVARIISIRHNVLTLDATAAHDALGVTITNDDRPPIQAAINSLSNGGIVNFPAGTYILGTPGASANQPIVLGSNLHLVGAGIGMTILKLCRDVNILNTHTSRFVLTGSPAWSDGPMFVNIGCRDWFFPDDNSTPPFTDSNIEIAQMTCDGNSNLQTADYESLYMPNPTSMPPTVWETHGTNPSMQWYGRPTIRWMGTDQPGTLAQGKYNVFIRFQDASGNEGVSAQFGAYDLGSSVDPATGLNVPNTAIQVYLPPGFPDGAVAVVRYIARDDLPTAPNSAADTYDPTNFTPTTEVDIYSNPRYERLTPIPLTDIQPWDGNPNFLHWPSIPIFSHTHYSQVSYPGNYQYVGSWTPPPSDSGIAQYRYTYDPSSPEPPGDQVRLHQQGNYPYPYRIAPSDSTASTFGYFSYVGNLNIHDVEIRNFATDGLDLLRVRDSQFNRLHVHHNGRNGISVVTLYFQNIQFNDCVIELNQSTGVDFEPGSGTGFVFNRCSFLNNGASLQVAVGNLITDLELNNCIFDGSYLYHIIVANQNISGLLIQNCTFLNNYSRCVALLGGDNNSITGVISGCRFIEATGRVQQFGPIYDSFSTDSAMIDIEGVSVSLRIIGNYFEPWFFFSPYLSPPVPFSRHAAIELGGTNGNLPIGPTTIMNNQFQSNPNDTRPYPVPLLGASYSSTNKDNQFITVSSSNLQLCTISGNYGDGVIYVMPDQIATYESNPT